MDLSSILKTAAVVVKGVNDYAMFVKDAPKLCESLIAELSSTRNILAELDNLIASGVRRSAFNSSH